MWHLTSFDILNGLWSAKAIFSFLMYLNFLIFKVLTAYNITSEALNMPGNEQYVFFREYIILDVCIVFLRATYEET